MSLYLLHFRTFASCLAAGNWHGAKLMAPILCTGLLRVSCKGCSRWKFTASHYCHDCKLDNLLRGLYEPFESDDSEDSADGKEVD